MKVFALATAAALLATSALAAPSTNPPIVFEVRTVFNGATPEDTQTRFIPTDGTTFYVDDASSITSITCSAGASCTFHGIDGSVTTCDGAETVPVGPPQVQLTAVCHRL